MQNPFSGIGMAVNMKTGNKYFVDVSEGTVTKVLGKVGKDGGSMGGFFDMFASSKTKKKVFFHDPRNIYMCNTHVPLSGVLYI